ncbi:MAG: hypothetical protein KDK70_33225, partial [Myxococcales bacterium]|nr:hypothetical protein [Myxococcales bacterium]
TDFGIARVVDGQTTSHVYGKLAYMPREQYTGDPVQQSDLFSTGAVFYEVLTGSKLRAACRNRAQLHEAIMAGRLPLLPGWLPRSVQEALTGMLEADPGRRTQSAKEVLRQLGALEHTGDPELDMEELYLDCVDSRHSWYTEMNRQAEEPTDRTEPKRGKRKTKRKTKRPSPSLGLSRGRVVFEVKASTDTEAPEPGRAWEPAQGHEVAFDEITTLPWDRPAEGDDAREVRS